MVTRLPEAELRRRARRVRLVLTDVDGVLTDAGVYYSARGEEMKRFSVRDGMAVELLRNAGIETGFLTREESPSVLQRARKLSLRHVYLGVRDKLGLLSQLTAEEDPSLDQLAYIGDDVNDLAVLSQIAEAGLTGAPVDAAPSVLELVHLRATKPGGHGAFREFAEWILELRQDE